jgi:hypothetical protein
MLSVFMLGFVMLSTSTSVGVVMLSVVVLDVIMPLAIILIVIGP